MEKQIVRSWDWELHNHRRDFETCPFCSHKMPYLKWDDYAVILVLDVVQGKHADVVVVSECPKCFEKSWTHQCGIGDFEEMSMEWQEAVNKEIASRRAIAKRQWELSLCFTCKKVEELPGERATWASCTCPVKINGIRTKREGCKHYVKKKVTKAKQKRL